MNEIVIFGAGGFAREVAHLIEDINRLSPEPQWNLLGYLEDNVENHHTIVNELPILGGVDWLNTRSSISVVIAIGSPKTKKLIYEKMQSKKHVDYPNLIHPSVNFSRFNTLGFGNVICEGNILTTNITLENFVTVNLNCTIGHDVEIKSYSTVLPNVSVSGNVIFEEGVDCGTNATIIQGLTVGAGTIVGAGSVVIKDLPANCTAFGIPAKPIKFHGG